jgi:hypothetical protein
MLLRDSDAGVSQEHGNSLQRHPGHKQFDCEGVPEAVGMPVFYSRQPEQRSKCGAPVAGRGVALALASPEEVLIARLRNFT